MSEESFFHRYLIFPLIVGVVVVLVGGTYTYFAPRFFGKDRQITISVEVPNSYLAQGPISNVLLSVNGVTTDQLYLYRITVSNSGTLPLRTLSVRYSFEQPSPAFHIFSKSYETTPKVEFGNVTEQPLSNNSFRYVYDLLNPGDKVVLTVLANEMRTLRGDSHTEGLVVKAGTIEEPSKDFLQNQRRSYLPIAAGVLGVLISFLTKFISERKFSASRLSAGVIDDKIPDHLVLKLVAQEAVRHGTHMQYEANPEMENIGYWNSADDYLTWNFELPRAATFLIVIEQACLPGNGGRYATTISGQEVGETNVVVTGSWQCFVRVHVGQVNIPKPGNYELKLEAVGLTGPSLMNVRNITLHEIRTN